jgi:hypothetical protein
MKLLAIALAAFPVALLAEDLPIQQTATGTCEIVVSADSNANREAGYQLVFRDRATKKALGTADTIGGYTTPSVAAETTKVVWHPSGEFVAFTDRATKHSTELYVYSLLNGKPSKIDFRDYVMNALGRVDATEIGLHCVSRPVSWEGDRLIVHLYFSVDRTDSGRHFYESTVSFQLYHDRFSTPRLQLLSVSAPKNPNE